MTLSGLLQSVANILTVNSDAHYRSQHIDPLFEKVLDPLAEKVLTGERKPEWESFKREATESYLEDRRNPWHDRNLFPEVGYLLCQAFSFFLPRGVEGDFLEWTANPSRKEITQRVQTLYREQGISTAPSIPFGVCVAPDVAKHFIDAAFKIFSERPISNAA